MTGIINNLFESKDCYLMLFVILLKVMFLFIGGKNICDMVHTFNRQGIHIIYGYKCCTKQGEQAKESKMSNFTICMIILPMIILSDLCCLGLWWYDDICIYIWVLIVNLTCVIVGCYQCMKGDCRSYFLCHVLSIVLISGYLIVEVCYEEMDFVIICSLILLIISIMNLVRIIAQILVYRWGSQVTEKESIYKISESKHVHDSKVKHDPEEHVHDSKVKHDHEEHVHDSKVKHDHEEHVHDSKVKHDHEEHVHDSKVFEDRFLLDFYVRLNNTFNSFNEQVIWSFENKLQAQLFGTVNNELKEIVSDFKEVLQEGLEENESVNLLSHFNRNLDDMVIQFDKFIQFDKYLHSDNLWDFYDQISVMLLRYSECLFERCKSEESIFFVPFCDELYQIIKYVNEVLCNQVVLYQMIPNDREVLSQVVQRLEHQALSNVCNRIGKINDMVQKLKSQHNKELPDNFLSVYNSLNDILKIEQKNSEENILYFVRDVLYNILRDVNSEMLKIYEKEFIIEMKV